MKKSILSGVIGFVSLVSVMGQGQIQIGNYLTAPYNQVRYGLDVPGASSAVNDPNVQIQVWYGKGVVTDENLLIPGLTTTVGFAASHDPGAGYGAGGYFYPVTQVLVGWQAGDTFTFQLRASFDSSFGLFTARSILWTESSAIRSTSVAAELATTVPGIVVVVPEPSVTALTIFCIGSLCCHWRLRRR